MGEAPSCLGCPFDNPKTATTDAKFQLQRAENMHFAFTN